MSKKFTSKQIIQNLSNGETKLIEVPIPGSKKNEVLIKTSKSLISSGTEKMLINFGKSNLVQKALDQPDKVKEVINKIRNDGVSSTVSAVNSKLNTPIPLGYCNVGKVFDSSNTNFETGQRVVSNGFHADFVRVPKNLVCAIPDNVDDDSAAFTIVGSIALQGVRLAKTEVGENVVVYGLGLIGLLAVQILKANGCNVLGVDIEDSKCTLAHEYGAEVVNLSKGDDLISKANTFSDGNGIDKVLITASTKSDELVHDAAKICRKRGKIILVGVAGLNLRREDFYEKEISFQVSCSYGPGRYDESYEENGIDYPYGFVRWTENRNFQTILNLMSKGSLDVSKLITCKYSIDQFQDAYNLINQKNSMGVILEYEQIGDCKIQDTLELDNNNLKRNARNKPQIGFLGGGNYASKILIPAFKKTNADLHTLVTSTGLTAENIGRKFSFKNASTNEDNVFKNEIDTVVIATRHNLHAEQVVRALKAQKNVFVEKPLALNLKEIERIELELSRSNSILMVGYNRRFSPYIKKIKEALDTKSGPKAFIYTINAGFIPGNHWTQDQDIGGGRIIGEVCHFVDLISFLSSSKVKSFSTTSLDGSSNVPKDNVMINLEYENGSIGNIMYLSNGSKSFPKERLEIFCDNSTIQLDNFIRLRSYGWKGLSSSQSLSQKKGHDETVHAFIKSVTEGSSSPISAASIIETAKLTIDIANNFNSK